MSIKKITSDTAYLTVDQLIAKLDELKLSGVSGAMPVAIPSVDNNGALGWMQRIERAGLRIVAKSDIEKGHSLCKTVVSRGVEVLVIQ